jgi:hypothetical protein
MNKQNAQQIHGATLRRDVEIDNGAAISGASFGIILKKNRSQGSIAK